MGAFVKNPCARDCPDRVLGCHARCRRWEIYRAYLDYENKKRRKNADYYVYRKELHERMAKKNRAFGKEIK